MAASGVGGGTLVGMLIGGGAAVTAPTAVSAGPPAVAQATRVFGPMPTGGGGGVRESAATAADASASLGGGALSQVETAATSLAMSLPMTGASDVMLLAGAGVVAVVAGILCLGLARRRAQGDELALAG